MPINDKGKRKGGSQTPPVDVKKILPDGYEYKKASNGKLEIWKGEDLIYSQDEAGAWIRSSVATGVGSLHIGDLHNNGSGGEQVVWVNTDSNIAFYPAWGGISIDGETQLPTAARVHGPLTDSLANGALSADESGVPYNVDITAGSAVAFFIITVVPAENYTGKLTWRATKSTGKVVAEFTSKRVCKQNVFLTIQLKYPLWVAKDQQFNIQLIKEDGTLLSTRRGSTRPDEPYRKTAIRTWEDRELYTEQKLIGGVSVTSPQGTIIDVHMGEPINMVINGKHYKIRDNVFGGYNFRYADGVSGSNNTSTEIDLGDTVAVNMPAGGASAQVGFPPTWTKKFTANNLVVIATPGINPTDRIVRFLSSAGEEINLPNLEATNWTVQISNLSPTCVVNAPKFKYAARLQLSNSPNDRANLFTALSDIGDGGIDCTNSSAGTTIAADYVMRNAGSIQLVTTNSTVTSVSFASLIYNYGGITIGNMANLTTVSFPSLTICGSFNCSAAKVTSISLPNIKRLGSFTATNCALTQASVDGILAKLVSMDGTSMSTLFTGPVSLNGGTNATPSAAGLASKAILVARGCTVSHN